MASRDMSTVSRMISTFSCLPRALAYACFMDIKVPHAGRAGARQTVLTVRQAILSHNEMAGGPSGNFQALM